MFYQEEIQRYEEEDDMQHKAEQLEVVGLLG
jgi:hypothetical protein